MKKVHSNFLPDLKFYHPQEKTILINGLDVVTEDILWDKYLSNYKEETKHLSMNQAHIALAKKYKYQV